MTQRREQTCRLAEVLGIEVEKGEATSELLDRCISEVEGRRAEARRAKDRGQTKQRRAS